MKRNIKMMKLALIILICISIILVGFLGIYVKNSNLYKNLLPEYLLASDLKGATALEFEVNKSTETVYYDKDGKKVDSSQVTEENENDYTKEEKIINNSEVLTEDNYNKVVEIMKKRLDFLDTDQYSIDLDKKSGKIVLTFEDDYPDDIKSILPMEGKMQLVDSNTEDIILDYTDFDSSEATYATKEDGSYITYINLKLNSTGVGKINNIDSYKTTENTESSEETETNTTNKLKIMFDDDEVAEITYDEILLTGKTLRITTADDLTTNSTIQSNMNTNTVVSKLSTIGKMPVVYELSAEEYIKTEASNYINYIIIGISIFCVAVSLFFVIKYKLKGLLATLGFATVISTFLIIIRLTNIPISLNGFAGILGLIILNTILVKNILTNIKAKDKIFIDNVKRAYIQSIDVLVIILIIFAVFSFSNMTVINSMGLLLFWGWLIILLENLIFTVPMLYIVNKEEKHEKIAKER